LYRPQVDADYGGKMRQDAYAANARLAAASSSEQQILRLRVGIPRVQRHLLDALLVLVLMVILGKRWQVVLFRRRRGGESSVGGIRVLAHLAAIVGGVLSPSLKASHALIPELTPATRITVRRLHLPSPASVPTTTRRRVERWRHTRLGASCRHSRRRLEGGTSPKLVSLAASSSSEQNYLPAFAEYDHQDEYEKGVEQMPLNHLAAIVGVDLRAVQVRNLFLVALATEDAGAAL
jgi:hypothetical protein